MKRYTLPCKFGSEEAPFHVYVGTPRKDGSPLENQARWLSAERGGLIPTEVMESFEKLHKIAIEKNVSYEDLCVYALGEDRKKASHIGNKNISKNPYVTSLKKPVRTKQRTVTGDTISKTTLEDTAVYAMQIANAIYPGTDYWSFNSRNLFLGVALYISVLPDKPLTLSEIMHVITNPDADYALCVVLDTLGGCLLPLCYRLIGQWLNQDKQDRDSVLARMTAGLIEFGLSNPKKADTFRAMRESLRKTLFEE